MTARLDLTRAQILAYRRRAQSLDARLPFSAESLRRAAWAGLQDSMPRAALLSIHARLADAPPTAWEDPSLVQLWGPRFNVYVVATRDLAIFSLGRLGSDKRGVRVAEDTAVAMHKVLGKSRMPDREVGGALGVGNAIRYAGATGTILIRWEGARAPTVWTVPRPTVDPREAMLELARRYLHVFGPTTAAAFTKWAGIGARDGASAFEGLEAELTAVDTPIGDAWSLASDEPALLSPAGPEAAARLLPSGDAYFLLQGADRELLLPDAGQRAALWTSRVWPGAVLVGGQIVGTWRRADSLVSIDPFRRLSPAEREAVETEAGSLPLPNLQRLITVRWTDSTTTVEIPDKRKRIVAAGYDAMADEYGRWAAGIKDDPRDRMIAAFSAGLPRGSRVLDLGCGSGLPSTRVLATRFDIVGVDLSSSQIELARSNVPGATFIVGDLTTVEFADGSFDGVTAFYSLNHVPREDHAPLFERIERWLVPGGRFLAALGIADEANWTGEWLGVPMYFSSHDPDTTRAALENSGFEVDIHEVVEMQEPEGPASFQWVLARKPGGET